jgi:hypothetical protein
VLDEEAPTCDFTLHIREGVGLGQVGFLTQKPLPSNGLTPLAFALRERPKGLELKLASTSVGLVGPHPSVSKPRELTHFILVKTTLPSTLGFNKPIGLNKEA